MEDAAVVASYCLTLVGKIVTILEIHVHVYTRIIYMSFAADTHAAPAPAPGDVEMQADHHAQVQRAQQLVVAPEPDGSEQ